jgi:hypothetical protein
LSTQDSAPTFLISAAALYYHIPSIQRQRAYIADMSNSSDEYLPKKVFVKVQVLKTYWPLLIASPLLLSTTYTSRHVDDPIVFRLTNPTSTTFMVVLFEE